MVLDEFFLQGEEGIREAEEFRGFFDFYKGENGRGVLGEGWGLGVVEKGQKRRGGGVVQEKSNVP